MESKLKYPCQRWKLLPSFKPAQIKLVEELRYWDDDLWACTSTGSTIRLDEAFKSKAEAIANGRKRIAEQQADIDKRQERLNKRKAALDKAEATP